MKKINPHNCDNISLFRDITQSIKDQSLKDILLSVDSKVEARLREYENKKSKLELVQEIKWSSNKAEIMRKLILNRTKFGLIRKKVKEANKNGKCLYCDLNEDDPLDHYMPKQIYPEFSIFSLNLVPSCSKCNRKKFNTWLDKKGNRSFINPYFDRINDKELLKCEILFANGNPSPKYFIDTGSTNQISEIMKNHVDILDLLIRYEKVSNLAITDYVHKGQDWKTEKDHENLFRKAIKQDLLLMKKRFGTNYWKVALLKSMLESKEFIRFCLRD